jgi:hypothetical protein
MAVVVHANTAQVTINSQGAHPDMKVEPQRMICHLTKGFGGVGSVGRAWTATGTVQVSVGPGDSLGLFQFGFVQFQEILDASFFYAGKHPSHGSVIFKVAEPPAMARKLALDSHDNQLPWTVVQPRFTRQGSLVTAKTGDHPLNKAEPKVRNRTTDRANFLFHVVDHRKFTTVFSAQDPAGAFTHMAHFTWELRYDFKVEWKASGAQIVSRQSPRFSMGRPIAGPPTDPKIVAHLADPQPPNANDEMLFAIVRTKKGGPPNRQDLARRFANVPPTFFK